MPGRRATTARCTRRTSSAALAAGFAALPAVDQLGVMMDAGALAAVGLQPEADLLDLTAKVPLDASPDLWQQVAGTLGGIDDLYEGDAKQQAAWRKYALSRLRRRRSNGSAGTTARATPPRPASCAPPCSAS